MSRGDGKPFIPVRLLKTEIREADKEARYYPRITGYHGPVVELMLDARGLKQGYRGRIGGGYGTSSYDWHQELPVDGIGVPRETLLVVELDEKGTEVKKPYFEWCRNLGISVVCNRCDRSIIDDTPTTCGARG